jgi:septal ring factor EnvC (AmiA/AmiB activator)
VVRVEILWHRRKTRRLTEITNINLRYRGKPVYSNPKRYLIERRVPMKIKVLIVLLAAFVLGFATFSYAQGRDKGRNTHESQGIKGIDQRLRNAHAGIDRGIQSGALTREEANRLKSELNRVRDDEARMKADGRLTRQERQRLEKELNRLEKHISQLKHNVNKRDKDHRR